MAQKQKNNNNKDNSIHTTRIYLVLIVISVIVMIAAAFITHGYDAKEIHISLYQSDNNEEEIKENTLKIGADLSKVPNDDEVEDILNKEMPNECNDCDEDDPLDCLEDYTINKILVQNPEHKNHLFIELITGDDTAYTIVIDLNTYEVLNKEGEIDDDECIEYLEEEDIEEEVFLNPGDDPDSSDYITTKPRE